MSSTFDSPDDSAASWLNDGEEDAGFRTIGNMLAHLDEALDLIGDSFDSHDTSESVDPGELLYTAAADHGGQVRFANHELTRLGESLIAGSEGHLLPQTAFVQSADPVTLFMGQIKSGFQQTEVCRNHEADVTLPQPRQHGSDRANRVHCFRIEPGDASCHRCKDCHPSEQKYGAWLKSVETVSRSLLTKPDDEDASIKTAQDRAVQDQAVPVSAALAIDPSPLQIVLDGKQFVRVSPPTVGQEPAPRELGLAATDAAGVTPREVTEQTAPQIMRCRNEMRWGPHWTPNSRAANDNSQ